MVNSFTLGREFFAALSAVDLSIALQVAAGRCPVCAGPLHRSDYPRKPRGGLIAPDGEGVVTRFSLCCGREGCRKRATPPSVRFLGRRVYLGAVVIVASVVAHALGAARAIRAATGIPPRTTRRWLDWGRVPFLHTEVFVAIRARLVGIDIGELPRSIVDRLPGSMADQVRSMLHLLAPITTGSVPRGSRFLRDIA
jgi:hypothetical protein